MIDGVTYFYEQNEYFTRDLFLGTYATTLKARNFLIWQYVERLQPQHRSGHWKTIQCAC